jgi:magnesium and cobalt transporter
MDPSSRPGLIERLTALLLREPEDREQLLALLHGAFERHLMDADALSIIEGALAVSDMAGARRHGAARPDARAIDDPRRHRER